jgi:hypothetical protein
MGKLFNGILNNRLEDHLTKNSLISNLQIGFKKKSRTTDHMFILRTLIDKVVRGGKKKLYACFVDFQKAFDRVPHDALFYKLLSLGIKGKLYDIIKDMYKKTYLTVKTNEVLTPAFKSSVGSRQGDPFSPNCFKIYTHDLPDKIGMDCNPPTMGKIKIPCLLYADDLILLSESAEGLQKSMNRLQEYCDEWGLQVNLSKTKVLIFNTQGKKQNVPFHYDNHIIENVKDYKYLGVNFNISGSFQKAQEELYHKGRSEERRVGKECRSRWSPYH